MSYLKLNKISELVKKKTTRHTFNYTWGSKFYFYSEVSFTRNPWQYWFALILILISLCHTLLPLLQKSKSAKVSHFVFRIFFYFRIMTPGELRSTRCILGSVGEDAGPISGSDAPAYSSELMPAEWGYRIFRFFFFSWPNGQHTIWRSTLILNENGTHQVPHEIDPRWRGRRNSASRETLPNNVQRGRSLESHLLFTMLIEACERWLYGSTLLYSIASSTVRSSAESTHGLRSRSTGFDCQLCLAKSLGQWLPVLRDLTRPLGRTRYNRTTVRVGISTCACLRSDFLSTGPAAAVPPGWPCPQAQWSLSAIWAFGFPSGRSRRFVVLTDFTRRNYCPTLGSLGDSIFRNSLRIRSF